MEQAGTVTLEPHAHIPGERVADGFSDFEALVLTEQRRIYRVLLSLVRDPDAADTLTQDCFLKAYQSRNGFRGDCSVRTWLLRIAVNLARDHGKNRRLQFWRRLFTGFREGAPDPEPVHPQPSPERVLIARERLDEVWEAVESLSAQQKTVFVLRFVEDMDLEEIAQTTNLRLGTVKAHLSRALGSIRRTVSERAT